MSPLLIVLIVVVVLIVAVFIGGLVASRRRAVAQAGGYASAMSPRRIRRSRSARAADRGWDRAVLETTAREALTARRPEWSYQELHLTLVDDRPGVEEDRAHFTAVGRDGEVRVVLVRGEDGWRPERVD